MTDELAVQVVSTIFYQEIHLLMPQLSQMGVNLICRVDGVDVTQETEIN